MATTVETRQVFEKLLKQKAADDRKTPGKEKTKRKNEKENRLENLEKSLTKDDPLLDSNTFDEEREKNLKNFRNSEEIKGKENKEIDLRICLARCLHQRSADLVERKGRPRKQKALMPSSGDKMSKLEKSKGQNADDNSEFLKITEKSSKTSDAIPDESEKVTGESCNLKNSGEKHRKSVSFGFSDDVSGVKKRRVLSEFIFRSDLNKGSERKVKSHVHVRDRDISREKGEKTRSDHSETKLDGNDCEESQDCSTSRFVNRPIRITVGNVDSLSNVFQSIWKKHSAEIIKEKIKLKLEESFENTLKTKSKSNFKEDRSLKSIDYTVGRGSKTQSVKSKESIKLKLKESFENTLKTKSKSGISDDKILKSIEYTVESGYKTKGDQSKEKDIKSKSLSQDEITKQQSGVVPSESENENLVVECINSEPNLYKTVWECLSTELHDGKSSRPSRKPVSQPNFTLCTLWKRSSNLSLEDDSESSTDEMVCLANSFESIEKILFGEEFMEEAETDRERKFHRHEWWREFWRRNGVQITFSSSNEEDLGASYIEATDKEGPKKPPRGKKKKARLKNGETENKEQDLTVDVAKPVKKKRTLRKKPDQSANESLITEQSEEAETPIPTPRKPQQGEQLQVPGEDEPEQETIPKTIERRKRRTKKRGTPRALPSTDTTQEVPEVVEASQQETQEAAVDVPPQEPGFEDDGTILGVTVHYCDHLRADLRYVAHPVVKVAIVDSLSGTYLNKCDSSRQVSSFYENESVNCILPLMTQPFDFKVHRSILPRWEEPLVFNEPFNRLTHISTDPAAPKPILFFVIRDFVAMAKVNNRRSGSDKGWHNVAWAFLKLVSSNNKPNAGRKMRLQLFHPPKGRQLTQDANFEQAYDWWLNHPRQRYPATLFVTVKAVVPPREMARSLRSMFATQPEEGAVTFNEMDRSLEQSEMDRKSAEEEDDFATMKLWSRLPGQTCKIPNAPFLRFWGGSEGAFALQFSNRGTKLAAACRHEATYPIFLYSIPGGDDIGVITGHQQLVYDLQWSKNDRYLLSASADGTAQVWDMERKEKPVHTLPHPCYVYSASYHPTAQYLIATGGYDTILRVWNIASVKEQLTQELDGHKAIINSIIFDQTGLNMYSGDGAGVIICWSCPAYEKAKRNIKTNWSIKTKIEDRDMTGVCINALRLHRHNNKILIHCRDSTVRLLDSRIHSIKKFTGILNHRQLVRSSLTPCGTFIFSGSEDGCVYVFNVETGDQVAIYNELGYTNAVHAVVYHPHDHMIAFCSYASNQSILLYKFNSAVATMEAGYRPDENILQGKITDEPGVASLTSQVEASKAAVKLERLKHHLDSVLSDTESDDFLSSGPYKKQTDSLNINAGNTVLPPQPRNQDGQVITPIKSPRSPGRSYYGQADSSYGPLSTWGSTFDSTTQVGTLLAPSYMSPHASPEARAMAQQYSRTGQLDHSGSWRPGIAAVGGSPYRPQGAGLPPDVSFTVDIDGKQKLNVTSMPGAESQSVVVVLFDYQANRSDELTVVRGDVIRVLYKDSANWWFGERTTDRRQGYFPSNYVEEQVATAEITKSTTGTPMFGVPETSSVKKIHALQMLSGRLQFYSQSESDGDEERQAGSSMRKRNLKPESPRDTPSPSLGLSLRSLTRTPESTTLPKSILQKSSPRPKISVKAPSSEGENIKEVSFADQKKKPVNDKAKQKLIESIQATIKASGVSTAPDTPPTRPSPSPRQTPKTATRPKPKTRTPSLRQASVKQAETSFTETPKPAPISSAPTPTPAFGILKSVQALMKQKENEPSFSQSILGGHELSTPKSQPMGQSGARGPIHSTAMKQRRDPVENDEDPFNTPRSKGSVVKNARPLPKIRKFADDETIPMVEMKGRASPSGHTNPAFNESL